MSDAEIGLAAVGLLFAVIALRLPIGVAMILISAGGITLMLEYDMMVTLLRSVPYDFSASWSMSSVPTFLAMGFICYHGQLTSGLFRVAKAWLGLLPGGMAIATIFAAAGFSAMSGSSVASAAAMGRIAIPEMTANRYAPSLATGTVAAAGTLGPLFPPSIILIIYGIFMQQPIGKLFLAGVMMGLVTVVFYVAVILLWTRLHPQDAPRVTNRISRAERWQALVSTLPTLVLVVIVFGGLFSGVFTATEAGAIGAFVAAVIGFASRALTVRGLLQALEEAVSTTCVIFIISIGAHILVRLLALSQADQVISDGIIALEPSRAEFFLIVVLLYLVIGMFLEPLGSMLLTIPILFPVLDALDIDLIWFGVILIKLLEVGMLTPPLGLNVFVIKSVVGTLCTTWSIFRAVSMFIIADVLVVIVALLFPALILYLT
ncbi:TRAP transporter large permease [Salipiger sp.]|uniref:TRAP transporter large permease n=1 Tax=Salipiger sp. TaxID=2078585 RepID=UPI003A96BCDE